MSSGKTNSKGDLIARLIGLGRGTPTFEVQEDGPPHSRTFRVEVLVEGAVLGRAEGRSKKEAERLASEQILRRLDGGSGTEEGAEEAELARTAWPIYAHVLAQSVEAALEFADKNATLQDVQRDAAGFYRDLLAELGHGPERGS